VHLTKPALFASALLLAAPLRANAECLDWLYPAFWQAATAAEMTRCLAAGADPNAQEEDGWTPLHLAAEKDSAETVAALLDAGADGGARNQAGRFPVDLAEKTKSSATALFTEG